MNADGLEENVFPHQQTVRAYAQYGESHYYGTRDGVWRQTDWHDADVADRVWGQPRQQVTGLAVLWDRIVVAAGNMLLTGPADDPAQWREVERTAFAPEPANNWQHLRVLAGWFVVRGSKGFYVSEDGTRWEKLEADGRQVRGVGPGASGLWVVTTVPGESGYVLGRSEDLRDWTWSDPLPEHFTPTSAIFPVIGDGVAVLAGTYASRGEKFNVPQAILSYRWPSEGAVDWKISTQATPTGGSLIEVAGIGPDAWARLPNGDLAASVNGFDWIRFAADPLNTPDTWFAGDEPTNYHFLLATKEGRYLKIYAEQLEYAGRGGAPYVAWQEVQTSAPVVAVAATSAVSANPVNDLMAAAYQHSIEQVKAGDELYARGGVITAKTFWEEAEQAGNHEAALRLALLYMEGAGVVPDLSRALALAEKAETAATTRSSAEKLVASLKVLAQATVSPSAAAQARADAFAAVGLARPTGNPEADFQLGSDYEEGRKGTAPSERKAGAISAYRRASNADHVLATMALVRLLNEQRLELAEKPDSGDGYAVRRLKELIAEIQERILRAARLGNGEALRIHALWIAQGQMGGDAQANGALALMKLQEAAEPGDLIAMRLLIRAAQAGEWKPPTDDTVEKLVEKLAAAGEADAKALIQQRDQQRSFEREYWGPRGVPVADPKAVATAVPTEANIVSDVPRPLFNYFQLARPTATAARSMDAARALVIAMMSDGRIDALERSILSAVAKPSFRLKLLQSADAQGAARELVFLGSYQPQARAFIERFIPVEGSDEPEMTPLMRRYFWIWTGVNGWKQAIAHAESSPAGRKEMLTVIQNWLGEKWPGSSAANHYASIRDELTAFSTVLSQFKGREHTLGRALVYEACRALDQGLNDVVPDVLYVEFKDEPTGY
ncbi:MAG: sel1 repeat family protein [Opitutaceae bacterium]|nr:sel1 repeat family protein [Opitutaceae bacterium]